MDNFKLPQLEDMKSIISTEHVKFAAAFLFGIVVIGALCVLFFYQSVAVSVNKNNRCKRIRDRYASSGVYTVEERSGNNTPLYSVSYNLATRDTKVDCKCPKGEVYNKFSFHVRDQFNKVTRDTSINCSCDDDYYGAIQMKDASTRIYEGYPELVAYMQDKSRDQFFRKPAMSINF